MKIIKRNRTEVEFNPQKIEVAIAKAVKATEGSVLSDVDISEIADYIAFKCRRLDRAISVEEIQDMVEDQLMAKGAFDVAKNYVKYRYTRELARHANTTDARILSLLDCTNEEVKQENANKNPIVNNTQRDYMAGEVSRDISERILLPADVVKAHREGIIHFHDMDYFAQHMHNCCLVNLDDMLQNGTEISGTMIERPHSFSTACNIALQIVAAIGGSQYGGQTISLTHLAPFVNESRKKFSREIDAEAERAGITYTPEQKKAILDERLRKDIEKGVQTMQYQVITLMTTNGQAPFLSVFMYLNEAKDEQLKADLALVIEEVLRQRTKGVKNSDGVYIAPAFPKLLYVLEEDNVTEDGKYFYLTRLAAECTARRLVPDYISEKKMMELKEGNCFPCMGCRSFLSPWKDVNGNYKFYGRFNMGVVTLNLPDVALTARSRVGVDDAGKLMDEFWKILDERLELCGKALMCRYERLKGTLSDAAPILWQDGALARLKKGERIDSLLENGYATISLGYAGMCECVYALIGEPHTTGKGCELGLEIMKRMNTFCDGLKAKTGLGFGIYGTPLESTTYKFAKCLQKRFGRIPHVSDRTFITNSYHVDVAQPIDAFTKLAFEAQFQSLSTGGAISYVEVPKMTDNIPAVISVIQFIYDNIMYAELNTKSDYCQECGFEGEILIVEDDGKLVWECPNCHNRDKAKMNIARRVCGYINSSNDFNQGRMGDVHARVLHL